MTQSCRSQLIFLRSGFTQIEKLGPFVISVPRSRASDAVEPIAEGYRYNISVDD